MGKAKKALIVLSLVLAFVSLGVRVFLDEYYYRNRPQSPEPSVGRLYEKVVHHGARVYLTYYERLSLELLPIAFLMLFIVAIVLHLLWPADSPFKQSALRPSFKIKGR